MLSHSIRQWPFWIIAAAGAISNAVLASIGPILIGQAFSAVLATPAQVEKLGGIAILAIITQGGRGLLQLARNFGFEFIAQRMERDVRNELYTRLLGKSMTFHTLQPVGDTMARATNDVREINFMKARHGPTDRRNRGQPARDTDRLNPDGGENRNKAEQQAECKSGAQKSQAGNE